MSMLPPIDNYNMNNKLRKHKHSGGASLFVNKKYNSYDINVDFVPEIFEFIYRNATINNEDVVYIGIYRTPGNKKVLYTKELSNFFFIMNLQGLHAIVAGNIFTKLLNNSNDANSFMDNMLSHTLYPVIFNYTRSTSHTVLDNIFTSFPDIINNHVTSYNIADHLPILAILENKRKIAHVNCNI